MTSKDLVFCMCCSKRIPRRRECEHRIKAHKLPTTPTPRKHPRLAFKAAHTPRDKPELKKRPKPICEVLDQDQDMHTTNPGPDVFPLDIEFPGPSTPNHDTHHHGQEDGTQYDTDQILTTCMAQRWTKQLDPLCLQSQPDEDLDKPEQDTGAGDDCNALDIPLEDGLSSDDSEYDLIDQDTSQDKSDQQYDLICDELGEEFELRYAMIGASHIVYPRALTKLMTFLLAEKLDEGDHTICRAFAFKVSTYMADAAWKKAPLAFQTTFPLPTLLQLHSRISFLAGFNAQTYDCCPNSCVCYTGPHAHATSCTYCGLSQYHTNGKPRKKFTYIPLIPRLQAFCANHKVATTMQYRCQSESGSVPGVIKDVFDGENYKALKSKHIQVDKTVFENRYFDDHRDIALGLSTDGFAPFNRRKSTTWPIIIFNYNLPPEI